MNLDPIEIKNKISLLEQTELRESDQINEDLYKVLLIYYLIDDDPMKAKFLWKRIPASFKTGQNELHVIWSLTQLLIERKYPEFFEKTNQLKESNFQFTTQELTQLVNCLLENSREKLLDLFNLAYSSISLKDMANMLKLNQQEALKLALNKSWELDDSKNYLISKKKVYKPIGIPNQIQMEQLTKIVSFIET